MCLITGQCWAHILPSSVYFTGADHVNLQSGGRWLAILNSHQELATEQSVRHFCAAGISDMSGITWMCLGSLIYDLGCAGAPAPGVSRGKIYKISKIHQDKVPV